MPRENRISCSMEFRRSRRAKTCSHDISDCPLLPERLDHLGEPRAAGITRSHLLDSLIDLRRRMHP